MKTLQKRLIAFAVAILLTMTAVIGDTGLTAKAEEASATVAAFQFNSENAPSAADGTLSASATTGTGMLRLDDAAYTGFFSGGLTANNWSVGDCWMIQVDATGYDHLTFTASMRGSGTAPMYWGVQYSTDEGATWSSDLGVYELTSKLQAKSILSLDETVGNTNVWFKMYVQNETSVKGATIASGGNVNLNDVIVTGKPVSGPEVPPVVETCDTVVANPEAGAVAAGTEVVLTTATEGATIYYNVNGTDNYTPYEEAIVVEDETKIYAYAHKDGLTDSEVTSFAYTISNSETKETTTKEEIRATKVDEIQNGDQVIMFLPSNNLVIGKDANGKKLTAVDAQVSENQIAVADDMALFDVIQDAETGYYSFVCDGKYLTSGATGSSLSFEEKTSEYSLWTLEKADNGVRIANANAKYGTSVQYIEYYSGFTTYSYKSANDKVYVFQMFRTKKGSGDEQKNVQKYDETITRNVGQWAGNANYDEAKVTSAVAGDKYATNDLLDGSVTYTAVVSGSNKKPYTSSVNSTTGAKTFYMGGTGLGSGSNDYMQFTCSSYGTGNLKMSFRLRASNTAAGTYQLQYSVDGTTFENFTTGTYHYAYTQYGVDGSTADINQSGEVTDGVAHADYAPTKYVEFSFDVPEGANDAEQLYIRLVAGNTSANKKAAASASGVTRIDSVSITGNPAVGGAFVNVPQANPASGAVGVGTVIELTSSENATIYYAINGGEYAVYDAANKPVIETLPAYVTTYAAKEGLKKSAEMLYMYQQEVCANVQATPNGGAISKNSKVSLKTTTENAKIVYAFDNGTDELEWLEYTKAFSLPALPCVVYVKATKDGCQDSAVSTLSFTEKTNSKYNIYFGQIHSHTNYSDGSGSAEEAFSHATKVANLDFLAVTDHSNSLDNAANSKISENVDTKDTDEWTSGHNLAKQYSSDDFTCIYGYEMTWSNGLGHMNTFNTPGFQSRTQTEYATYSTALQNYYKALKTVPDSMSQFNHPGTTFGDFSDFAYFDRDIDTLITLIEVGNGEGTIGSSGYFPSYEYYTRALDKGWHVAPSNNQDNHKGRWGDANTARTVVLADTNNEDNIYDAMRNYRVYATEDNNLNIYYTLDDNIMGSILGQDQVGENVTIKAELKDESVNDKIGKVEVIVNGGLSVASQKVDSNEETVTFTLPSNYSYYYLKITETDGDIAVTSPVWVGEVEACGINGVSTTKALAVQNEELDLNVELYNNESSELTIDRIVATVTDAEGKVTPVVDTTGTEAGVPSVACNSTKTYTYHYTYPSAGKVTYEITVYATLNGVEKVYSDKLDLNYVTGAMVTDVIIDGSHYNDYVSGYYGGNVNSFIKICAENNIRATIKTDAITEKDLEKCSLLIVSAPAKKNGTATAGDYTVSHYDDAFLKLVSDYVANGGNVIVCGLADYSDTASCQTATEQNKLLEAIGATIRMNSDEVYDEVNNGGQAYRLYPTNFNMASDYLAGVVKGQTYSQYSGCSVDISNQKETDFVTAPEALVSGFDTTYSINCKDDNGASAGNTANDNKGNVTFLAHQTTKAGGHIFVAGGVFMSDFEVKAEIDNNDSLPYVNKNIITNIINDAKVVLPTSTIAAARKGEMGDVFAVEGYVTSGTSNEYTTFFDTIYLQDETAGIDIFPYAESGLAIGTKMRIVGFVSEYQGDKELKVISSEILSDEAKIYEPKEVSTKEATNYEALGGSLLKTAGKVTRVAYNEDGTVAEFWLTDQTGVEAAIFIDGYIYSGTTGKNNLSEFVKEGVYVSAIGVLYMHPEGDSDVSVPVFRVRNCDDIILTQAPVEEEKDFKLDKWVPGCYTTTKPVLDDNQARISIEGPVSLPVGEVFKAKITDDSFKIILRKWDLDTKKMSTVYLKNGENFVVEAGIEYYVSLYNANYNYKNLNYEVYKEMMSREENPLQIAFVNISSEPREVIDTLATGQEVVWISGSYSQVKATYETNVARICMKEALQVEAGKTYTAAITKGEKSTFEFRYIVREKKADGTVTTFFLSDGQSFVAAEGSEYLVSTQNYYGNYKNLDFTGYLKLMEEGLHFDLK